ncbi:BadM/Rrf2 family transcriptional regulator [Planifilum fimeticola]|jgi:Rrf2 family protein|uniref:BadM/Rrf2 family transcriptional regulator n=1 Tax=Planifilum fimeticola TaxID=201975 RepID=A0A2T0LAF1_9BACL|nr:Rrf2 family transcriptional regulator [Planifilum fimeticola]PRX38694.1 BadM/Rrf2 family transcriptional regulator [Planifilum fimeticola]
MHYSIGVEYALHCLVHLVDPPVDQPIGIKELAAFQGASESYLSKIFSRLAKAGIVRSTPGVKGGYELAKPPEEISFWDVVEAIEGPKPIFQCRNILDKCILYRENGMPPSLKSAPCHINRIMLEAEQQMRDYLKEKNLMWLKQTLEQELPENIKTASREWFRNAYDK